MTNIAVVGTGYVGLVTGTCLAETGNHVICVDVDVNKVRQMRQGIVPIYEPDLDKYFERNVSQGRLTFTTDLAEAVASASIIFLALPTPPGADGEADLSAVMKVAAQLGGLLNEYKVIVDKSTVPVGTADKVREEIARNAKAEFDVVSNPEFLREGFAVDDFMKPERIVVGTGSDRARKMMEQLYKPYVRQGNPILFMDERSAEVTKYAANAFLATKITFMNEVARYCEAVGADVDQVRIGIGSDSRIGKRFLFPGVGYGGSCFPKDVKALIHSGEQHKSRFAILDAVEQVNREQKTILVPRLKRFFGGNLKGKKLALWGLAFKPDTDDIREAPALDMIAELLKEGARITAFDPEAMNKVKATDGGKGITFAQDQYEALLDADALIIATEWSVFRNPDFNLMARNMKSRVIFDGRNVFDLETMSQQGFYYSSIGRKTMDPR
jgi:UDPglucose 6-dehydrogenase